MTGVIIRAGKGPPWLPNLFVSSGQAPGVSKPCCYPVLGNRCYPLDYFRVSVTFLLLLILVAHTLAGPPVIGDQNLSPISFKNGTYHRQDMMVSSSSNRGYPYQAMHLRKRHERRDYTKRVSSVDVASRVNPYHDLNLMENRNYIEDRQLESQLQQSYDFKERNQYIGKDDMMGRGINKVAVSPEYTLGSYFYSLAAYSPRGADANCSMKCDRLSGDKTAKKVLPITDKIYPKTTIGNRRFQSQYYDISSTRTDAADIPIVPNNKREHQGPFYSLQNYRDSYNPKPKYQSTTMNQSPLPHTPKSSSKKLHYLQDTDVSSSIFSHRDSVRNIKSSTKQLGNLGKYDWSSATEEGFADSTLESGDRWPVKMLPAEIGKIDGYIDFPGGEDEGEVIGWEKIGNERGVGELNVDLEELWGEDKTSKGDRSVEESVEVSIERSPLCDYSRGDKCSEPMGLLQTVSEDTTFWMNGKRLKILQGLRPKSPTGVKRRRRGSKLRRHKRKTGMVEVTVVEGGLAALPCDLKTSDPNDSVQLILWIKEGLHTPLYSYDYRELLGGRPKETKPDANSTLARRTSFTTDRTPSALLVERVEAEDGGIYRCRVDFLLSPTINKRVNLTIIVPPSRAKVGWRLQDSEVTPVTGGEAGPFLENSTPTLICVNDDGWPPSSVKWFEGDELLDESFTIDHERQIIENDLTLSPLTRADLGRRLTCVASNTNSTQPATATVQLTMTLSIMGVKVMEVEPLWAGENSAVYCRIWGSRPPPNTVWWLGSQMLPPTDSKVIEEENVTISSMHFVPVPKDDGAMLICQATNEKLPDQAVQDSRLISVNYSPIVKVQLGRSLDPRRIKEGDDVYFECSAEAKPPVSKVIWKHKGKELVHGPGVILSNMSLVVQGVTRSHGGNYTCHATNIRSTSASPPLYLDVKYTPVCALEQRQQHSVGKLENAEISCKVHANPPNVTFRWTFNNTAEAIDVPDGRFVVVGTESRVNYTPMNELDYGTLLCWANNSIGMQQEPCVFHIVAAGKPDPPHNCRVFDVTISSLQVTCLPGDDGGLSQSFLLRVYLMGSTLPVIERESQSPSFSVSNLRPATAYKIVTAAVNDKGTSRLNELKAYTVRVPETQEETSAEPTRDRDRGSRIPLAVIIGSAVAAVPTVTVVAVIVWLKLCRGSGNDNNSEATGTGNDDSEGCDASGHGTTMTTETMMPSSRTTGATSTELMPDSSSGKDDRNPDIISHTPDPTAAWLGNGGDIATISSSSYLITNPGEPPYTGNGPPPIDPTVSNSEYSQLMCEADYNIHVHGGSGQYSKAAVTQVPYYIDSAQQQQVVGVDIPLPPPSSYNQGQLTLDHHQVSASIPTQSYSTLERKRRQHTCQLTEQISSGDLSHQTSVGYDPSQQTIFPHLYQNPPGNLSKNTRGSSQYNLAQMQDSGIPLPPTAETLVGHGSLRRSSSKKGANSVKWSGLPTSSHCTEQMPPPSPPTPTPPPPPLHHHHTHHHHPYCDIAQTHATVGFLEDSGSGSASNTLKRTRRSAEKRPPCDGQESSMNSVSADGSGTLKKSKRESAV